MRHGNGMLDKTKNSRLVSGRGTSLCFVGYVMLMVQWDESLYINALEGVTEYLCL